MLMLMSALAQAGDLEITVIDGDEELSATLSGLAACRSHQLELEGEEGTWRLSFRVEELEGNVMIDADVRRLAVDRELQMAPSLLLRPGEEGMVSVLGGPELIVLAEGFEGQTCQPRSHSTTTRRRTRVERH